MKDIIKKKIQMLEKEIEAIEINIASLENKKADKNKYIRKLQMAEILRSNILLRSLRLIWHSPLLLLMPFLGLI